MEAEFLEQLQCPICRDIPEREVYQCKNGHTLCDTCFSATTNCPQCRIPFGSERIRCRALESLIEETTSECPNTEYGCTYKGKRKDIKEHCKVCPHMTQQICRLFGYPCGYKSARSTELSNILYHFESNHPSVIHNSQYSHLHYESCDCVTGNNDVCWHPVILDTREACNGQIFIFGMRYRKYEKSLKFGVMRLPDNSTGESCTVWVDIQSTSQEWPTLSWKTQMHENFIVLKFPFEFLKEYYLTNGKIKATIGVVETKNYDKLQEFNHLALQATPCDITPFPNST